MREIEELACFFVCTGAKPAVGWCVYINGLGRNAQHITATGAVKNESVGAGLRSDVLCACHASGFLVAFGCDGGWLLLGAFLGRFVGLDGLTRDDVDAGKLLAFTCHVLESSFLGCAIL